MVLKGQLMTERKDSASPVESWLRVVHGVNDGLARIANLFLAYDIILAWHNGPGFVNAH